MEGGLIEYEVQQAGVISLNHEEEDFLSWNAKECGANNGS